MQHAEHDGYEEQSGECGDGEAADYGAPQGGVLFSALAMVLGMLPMAFALGEGGEQNAPLGRAVIGGLTVATVATLFFVPTVFSVLHRKTTAPAASLEISP